MKTPKSVLLLPLNYDHVQHGMIQGFRQAFGTDAVTMFDFMCAKHRPLGPATRTVDQVDKDFVEYVGQRKPDLVFMQLQDSGVIAAGAIDEARLASPATVFAHWTGDYRPQVSAYLASICSATDITFASSVGQLPAFVDAGAREATYLQIGLDWDEDVLGLPAWTPPFTVPDIVFCGSHYANSPWPIGTAQRLEAIRTLQGAGFDIGVVGTGWPSDIRVVGTCTAKQQHHVYTRAKVVLSVSHANDVDRYFSDRLLIAMASGTPVVSFEFPGMDDEFSVEGDDAESELVPRFSTPAQLLDIMTELRANEDWRQMLGIEQRAFVRATASWFSRIVETVIPFTEGWR